MEVRVGICDDELQDRKALRGFIVGYTHFSANIAVYTSADALITGYEQGARFDLLFMDIQMAGTDGYTAIKLLREEYGRDEWPLVVFTTVTDKYVFAGYDVCAIGYLRKPVTQEKLYQCLDVAHSELCSDAIELHTSDGNSIVRMREIRYIESDNNRLTVVTMKDVISVRMTLEEMKRKLTHPNFVQTHRCYIANLAHMLNYDDQYIYFDDSCKVKISRRYRGEFNRAKAAYLRR
jgi:DNA-binding LytR/AlgR family response regulator